MLGCGESQKEAIRPDFSRAIIINFHGPTISSDVGFLLFRMIPFCGRLLMRLYLVLVACVFCLVATNAQADTINMSHDLVRLGIATQNLAPNH
jgi:hypothetical protein